MKKPDIVVWSEELGYYAKKLSYATDLGAPVIKVDDIAGWKKSNVVKANKQLESEFKDLMKRLEDLQNDYRWSELIYKAKYDFEPVLDTPYYLYCNNDGIFYLSLISPNEWKTCPSFFGTFLLDSSRVWKKID